MNLHFFVFGCNKHGGNTDELKVFSGHFLGSNLNKTEKVNLTETLLNFIN